ncbi:hypothetical protein ACQPYE_28105 [Actinosynnema sp. CA-299493]
MHPTGSLRTSTVLRLLAVVFLGVAVVDAVVAVHEAVMWPLVAAIGCTGVALWLERLVFRSRVADRAPDGPALASPRHPGKAGTSVVVLAVVPAPTRK